MSALHHLTVAEAGALIGARRLSPVDLVDAVLERIAAVDHHVRSYVLVLHERARAAARTAEVEIAAGRWRGPLHGIPFGVKDNYHVAGVRTTGGSRLMLDSAPQSRTASLVARLEQAGAILLGKLNTWEYGTGDGKVYHDLPFSAARNPWNVAHFTGGSSTGAGASVAAGTALFALGSDTGGSIRLPAAGCGLQGLKPTFGLTGRAGCLPNCWSLDHVGALTWTVEDQAIVLGAIAGYDPGDPGSVQVPVPDYRGALAGGVRGVTIGIVRDLGSENDVLDAANRSALEEAARVLAEAGATVREMRLPFPLAAYRNVSWIINWAESFSIHAAEFLDRRGEMGMALRSKMMMGACIRAEDYLSALRSRQMFAIATDAMIRTVDAVLIPGAFHTAPSFGTPDAVPLFTRDSACSVFNVTGHPAISVCTGFDPQVLPLNMQIVGRYFDEATVLSVAQAFERATPYRQTRPSIQEAVPNAVMPGPVMPVVAPALRAEARALSTLCGLSAFSHEEEADLASKMDRVRTVTRAMQRSALKEADPVSAFRVPSTEVCFGA